MVLAGSILVMIIGTTRDPATPFEWSVALSKEFPNSFLVTLDSDGHTGQSRRNLCVDRAVNSYLLAAKGLFIAKACVSVGK